MLNIISVYKPLLKDAMRLVGMRSQLVQIEPGTVINFWGPTKPNSDKPTILLLHGFIGNAIFTWQFQVLSLRSSYNVYAPDLLFFGDSHTDSAERSMDYGGMIGFRLDELYPGVVESLVVNGAALRVTESISADCLKRIGAILAIGSYTFPWLPNFFYKDFLVVEYKHRKERAELLKAMVTSDEFSIPNFPQRIRLLWGENDKIFTLDYAKSLLRQMGLEANAMQVIEKAGHVALIERPYDYNHRLHNILKSLNVTGEMLPKTA
uniref:AB hydrolase-1 domain-containing protein n=1 Tax=Kalanchoe fedtschenkoi TaxID=63787 RepID=A0A7N0TDS1_KALFE